MPMHGTSSSGQSLYTVNLRKLYYGPAIKYGIELFFSDVLLLHNLLGVAYFVHY